MILPVESKEISRRLRQYLPEFARPLLDRLIERVKYETQQEIALEQEQRRRKEITQNVLGEAGPAADARPAARRLEYDERIAFIVEHLAGPTSYTGDLEDRQRQRAREELIQAAEQTD